MSNIARWNIVAISDANGAYVSVEDHLAEVERSKDWLEVAAQVADLVGAKARTDDGKETADKIARRIRAMMEEGR